jgi:hypothetical protein
MSLRSFFLWFWGIVFGSGIAGGATLAVLQSQPKPPPAPAIQQVALAEPLPLPPVPAIDEGSGPRQAASSRPRSHVFATRPIHEARRFAGLALAPRITVVPPIPPAPSAVSENLARVTRLPSFRSPPRVEPRQTVTAPSAPSPRPRAYAYARNYPRYNYYSYSYPYQYSYYPYPYYYAYSY